VALDNPELDAADSFQVAHGGAAVAPAEVGGEDPPAAHGQQQPNGGEGDQPPVLGLAPAGHGSVGQQRRVGVDRAGGRS
jgi:hypothetical protein